MLADQDYAQLLGPTGKTLGFALPCLTASIWPLGPLDSVPIPRAIRLSLLRFIEIFDTEYQLIYFNCFSAGRPPPSYQPPPPLRRNEGWDVPIVQGTSDWTDRPVKVKKQPPPLSDSEAALFNNQAPAAQGIHPSRLAHITGRPVDQQISSSRQESKNDDWNDSRSGDSGWNSTARETEPRTNDRESREWNSHERQSNQSESKQFPSGSSQATTSVWGNTDHIINPRIDEARSPPRGSKSQNTFSSQPERASTDRPTGSSFSTRDTNESSRSSNYNSNVQKGDDGGWSLPPQDQSGWVESVKESSNNRFSGPSESRAAPANDWNSSARPPVDRSSDRKRDTFARESDRSSNNWGDRPGGNQFRDSAAQSLSTGEPANESNKWGRSSSRNDFGKSNGSTVQVHSRTKDTSGWSEGSSERNKRSEDDRRGRMQHVKADSGWDTQTPISTDIALSKQSSARPQPEKSESGWGSSSVSDRPPQKDNSGWGSSSVSDRPPQKDTSGWDTSAFDDGPPQRHTSGWTPSVPRDATFKEPPIPTHRANSRNSDERSSLPRPKDNRGWPLPPASSANHGRDDNSKVSGSFSGHGNSDDGRPSWQLDERDSQTMNDRFASNHSTDRRSSRDQRHNSSSRDERGSSNRNDRDFSRRDDYRMPNGDSRSPDRRFADENHSDRRHSRPSRDEFQNQAEQRPKATFSDQQNETSRHRSDRPSYDKFSSDTNRRHNERADDRHSNHTDQEPESYNRRPSDRSNDNSWPSERRGS